MSAPLWAVDLASAFWAAAGSPEPFPRNLRRPIAMALPLSVVLLPNLCLRSVKAWLSHSGVFCDLDVANRRLRACLIARMGYGIAFIDGADAEDEQRLSLAHELAHFLRDYWQPRETVCRRIGAGALEVLDGRRPPDAAERVSALLRSTPLGFHTHLMDRMHGTMSPDVASRERDADRLAFELLAPADELLETDRGLGDLEVLLRRRHGLPPRAAASYASMLVPAEQPIDPILRRLGAGR